MAKARVEESEFLPLLHFLPFYTLLPLFFPLGVAYSSVSRSRGSLMVKRVNLLTSLSTSISP